MFSNCSRWLRFNRKNKESKKVVRVNGGVVEKTKNVADNSENTSTETKEETSKTEEETTKDNKRVIDPNKPMIALTFDDGPGERTLELLETLEKYNVRASFLCVAQVFPETI